MLQAQLLAAQTSSEVAGYVQQMKAVMLGNGLQPGFRFYIAQLRAAVRMHDVQVSTARDLESWNSGSSGSFCQVPFLPTAMPRNRCSQAIWQLTHLLRLGVSSLCGIGVTFPAFPPPGAIVLQPAIQAFRALRHRNASPLQAIDDDLLGQLLLELRWVVGLLM